MGSCGERLASSSRPQNGGCIVVVVAQKLGVVCRSCGTGIEIDDEYIPGVRVAEMAASLYGHFCKRFPKSVEREIVRVVDRPWQKPLTCGNPDCGKTHIYKTDDLRLYDG
jgi:hypothetical protein